MYYKYTRRGFTLIELLVVVLIIGILAAIAVPQYQKAVMKTRLAEAATVAKALIDGMEIYVLENGVPSEGVFFIEERTDNTSLLDITVGPFDCSEREDFYPSCVLRHFGYTNVSCDSTGCQVADIVPYPNQEVLMGVSKTHDGAWRADCMGDSTLCTMWNNMWQ